jgi:glucokinase
MPPRSKYLVGVDLGGTNIVAGALAEDGSDVLALRTEPTRADQGADAVVDRIVRIIDRDRGDHRAHGRQAR